MEVAREVDFGVYLNGEESGEILLPAKYVPVGTKVGDKLDVFIYLDQDERLIATTEKPYAQVGEFAYLEVAWTNEYGAFLSWGLLKDVFAPFREQRVKMERGRRYMVYIFVDPESYRIVASSKIDKFLSDEVPAYQEGDEVDAQVWQYTDLGYKMIIDNKFAGLVYDNEVFSDLRIGEHRKAYIKKIREDGKIDLLLQKPGREAVEDFSDRLLRHIGTNGGFVRLTDKTPAEEIYALFGVSKKVFKRAVGTLYRERLITITDEGLKLASR